ncbi:MAG: hypothetical protein DRH23_05910 [Deltaproteobacteria bacterium]|nr:MAG: hypothetical protein DRH23_05910 [Deltaproteobacteria bacterium]
MGGRRVGRMTVLVVIALCAVWWLSSAPPDYLEIGPAVDLGGIAESILAVEAPPEALGLALEHVDSDVPGHDDLLLYEEDGVAFVSGMYGWIWRVPLGGGGERFADVPLMPSGLRAAPDDHDVIYFCVSRLHGEDHPDDERVGLYRLTISTREVTPVVTDVPMTPAIPELHHKVFADTNEEVPTVMQAAIDRANSRPLAFCNDLDVSLDGKRIYFTEPIAYEGASMGGGAVGEAITLGENGRLWRHDLATGETRLIAEGFHFIDGILIDPHPVDTREQSVLVTQTPGFAVTRFFFGGARAGTAEAVWTALPGMPDGMDRDAQGRIWIGLYRKRSNFLTWAHNNPWIKPLMLRLPLELLPVPKETGLLALSPDGATPLYYAIYEGPKLGDAAVGIPGSEHLYIANFDRQHRGLIRMSYPDLD